ncbi:flagellar hook-length control protein FliK [Scandinavium goeteborgense]|uniref:flagellar hook-length control protein FliK n=1 Tax=Scandinavium goeteborgense TaxID=1851514 RepID=UPI000F68EA74|nr:flagellar hook-length control protein FliK [Scandinavium goeteborgense]QKN82891.1 flagellar hook-length control protein FliK [Scandinavium goeteborgense]
MNSVQPAVTTLLADPESTAVQPQSGDAGDFSLENATSGVMSRHRAHATKESQPDTDTLPQDLSALMAMLLTKPAATPEDKAPAAGQAMMKTTALAGVDARSLVKLMGMMSAHGEQQDASQSEHVLPQALQSLLNQATAQQQQGSASQQATLAKFAAQNLHALGSNRQAATNVTNNRATLHENLHAALKTTVANHVVDAGQKQADAPLTAIAAMSDFSSRATSETDSTMPVMTVPVASTSADELGEKLNDLLKDRIQFQLQNQQQVSTIRLDPPSMGKLEIVVHLDANQNLNVHIGASQADVMKTLQQFSDHLRQHLVQQNFMQVNVQVSSDGQSQQQHQQQRQEEEAAVLASRFTDDAPDLSRNESVLLKV